MKGRLLPIAIIGLILFLSAVVWEASKFSSKQYEIAVSHGTYGRKGQTNDRVVIKDKTQRKIGLRQPASKAAINNNAKISTPFNREAAGTSIDNSGLADPAIILFCYDR